MTSRKAQTPGGEGWDFFVSYTAADKAWAEWIAWQLEDADYRVLIQAWDFVPGAHWMGRVEDGVRGSQRVLAVLSHAYLTSVYGQKEWHAAFRADPGGQSRKVIPVRVEDCPRPGLLDAVVSFDLFDLDTDQARTRLLHKIKAALDGRAKPPVEPLFPGAVTPPAPAQRAGTDPTLPSARLRPAPPAVDWSRATLTSTLTDFTDTVGSVGFSPDGRVLAAGTYDDPAGSAVWQWDVTTLTHPRFMGLSRTGPADAPGAVGFSSTGRVLAVHVSGEMGWWDVTNPADPIILNAPPLDDDRYTSVCTGAFSPDGRIFAVGGGNYDGGKVWLWDVTSLADPVLLGTPITGPLDPVIMVRFSPDGRGLVAVDNECEAVWLWDVTDPATPTPLGAPLAGGPGRGWEVAVSPSGRLVAANHGSRGSAVWLWDVTTPTDPIPLNTAPTDAEDTKIWMWAVAFSPDGRTLVASNGRGLQLWDTTTPADPMPLATLKGPTATGMTEGSSSVAFSPDGRTLAAGNGRAVHLWTAG